MRRLRSLRAGLAAAAALLLAGCATHPVDLGPDLVPGLDQRRGRTIRASACGFNLSTVIPIGTQSVYQRAFSRLRESAPFDLITDVHIQVYWRYAVVGLRHCAVLEAKAYPRRAEAEPPGAGPAD